MGGGENPRTSKGIPFESMGSLWGMEGEPLNIERDVLGIRPLNLMNVSAFDTSKGMNLMNVSAFGSTHPLDLMNVSGSGDPPLPL